MPRYRNEFGVVVDIPAEKAGRINGLTPVDAPAPTEKPAAKPKPVRRSRAASHADPR